MFSWGELVGSFARLPYTSGEILLNSLSNSPMEGPVITASFCVLCHSNFFYNNELRDSVPECCSDCAMGKSPKKHKMTKVISTGNQPVVSVS